MLYPKFRIFIAIGILANTGFSSLCSFFVWAFGIEYGVDLSFLRHGADVEVYLCMICNDFVDPNPARPRQFLFFHMKVSVLF